MAAYTEKSATLRVVKLFAELPNALIEEIATLVQEVTFAADETIFHQGDYGDAMYVIVAGQVQIHSGGRTLGIMEKDGVFGEMAILDPEPRSAAATAITDTRLLRLSRTSLTELIATQPALATGLLQNLCRQLRARTTVMVEDYHYLQQVAQLTTAASQVEEGIYVPEQLDNVTERTDALGQLARVFQRMIREVYAREEKLRQQVQQLRIEIDKSKTARQVAAITGTDYFRTLQEKARALRDQNQ